MSKGLLTLQTDLKNLRYGSDKPYVTKDVNNPPTSNQTGMQVGKRIDDLSRITKMLIDRPGLNYLANEAILQQVGVEDRIAKARKQGKSVVGAVLQQAGRTAVTTVKLVGSTLGQVAVNGTGTHFLKAFRTDTYLQPSGGNTRSAFAQFFGAGGVEGAPYALRGEEVAGTVKTSLTNVSSKYDYDEYLNLPTGSTQARVNTLEGKPVTIPGPQYETTAQPSQLGRSNQIKEADQSELLPDNGNENIQNYNLDSTYVGSSPVDNIGKVLSGKPVTLSGPQYETTAQPFELGRSNKLSEADQSELLPNNGNDGTPKWDQSSTYTGKKTEDNISSVLEGGRIYTGGLSGSYRQTGFAQDYQPTYKPFADPMPISAVSSADETTGPTTEINDFRSGSLTSYAFDYSSNSVKKELRINLGDQGAARKGLSYGAATSELARDGVNYLDIVGSRANGVEEGRDLAKFFFEVIAPSEKPAFLYFRAFIDSIDDSYSADWQAHKYIGRAENFYTYGGFDRDINISFNIAAATRSEMRPLYRKMVYLASATAPTYGGENNFMRGTVVKLTLGSYFSQIPGVLTSVKYTVDNNAPWEIAMANPEAGTDDDVQELPMVLKCSITFKPIHSFAPQTGLQHYFTNPVSVNKSKPFF